MLEAAAKMYCKPEVNFNIKNHTIDGKLIIEADIAKSEKGPHLCPNEDRKWLVYIRRNDQNLLANTVLLKVWKREKRKKGIYLKYSKKEKLLLEYLLKNETISLSKYINIANLPRKVAENVLVNLILLNIIEMDITEKQVFYKLLPDAKIEDEYFSKNKT